MIFGLLFPTVPTKREWAKLPIASKAQWILLGGLQITAISLEMMSLLFA